MNTPKVIHNLAELIKNLRQLYKRQHPSATKDQVRAWANSLKSQTVILAAIEGFELWGFGAVRGGNDWDARVAAVLQNVTLT